MLLRARIITGISIAMCLLMIGLWQINSYNERAILQRMIKQETTQQSILLEHIHLSHHRQLQSRMSLFIRNKKLLKAVSQKNSTNVKGAVKKSYNTLKLKAIIDDIIITDARGVTLHSSSNNLQFTSDNNTKLQALKFNKPSYSPEVTYQNRLYVSFSFPLYQSGKVIGSITLLKKFDAIAKQVNKNSNLKILITNTEKTALYTTNPKFFQPINIARMDAASKSGNAIKANSNYYQITTIAIRGLDRRPIAFMYIAQDITSPYLQQLQISRNLHILLGALVMLFLCAMTYWLYRQFKPMTQSIHVLLELAKGNFDIETPPLKRDNEIGKLLKATQVFRESLIWKAAEQEVEKERRQVLESALQREKELSYLQDTFITMIRFEFKTPLTAIETLSQDLSQLLWQDDLDKKEIENKLHTINSSVERLKELVDKNLLATHVDDGNIKLTMQPCNMHEVIEDVCKKQQHMHHDYSINYTIDNLPDLILADGIAIGKVIDNLISNATKYSPGDNRVDIDAKFDQDNILISVRDYGLGIDEEDIPHIGERHFRAKSSIGTIGNGTGLNLSRMLLAKHDGILAIESSKGQGTTVTIQFPAQIIQNISAVSA